MKKRYKIAPNVYILDIDGRQFYLLRFMRNGRAIEKRLGRVNEISRRSAIIAANSIMAGYVEPVARDNDSVTFAEAAAGAILDLEKVKQWKNDRSKSQWVQSISDYVLPFIGDKPIESVTRADIIQLLTPIWYEKHETATRVRARIENIINWAIRNELRTGANPAVWKGNLEFDFPKTIKAATVKHHTAMTLDEARRAVDYCLSHPSPVSGAILLGLSTATRVQEFRYASRDEIDGDVWIIPPDRRKDTKPVPFYVPLSPLALEAVKMGAKDGALFTYQNRIINENSPRLKLIDIIKRPVTMHGCRSTFRDWAASAGIDRVVSEKCLMHNTGNAVEQAYQRSDLFDLRKEVMLQWSSALTAGAL